MILRPVCPGHGSYRRWWGENSAPKARHKIDPEAAWNGTVVRFRSRPFAKNPPHIAFTAKDGYYENRADVCSIYDKEGIQGNKKYWPLG